MVLIMNLLIFSLILTLGDKTVILSLQPLILMLL